MSTTKQLEKLVIEVSNKKYLNYQYAIEHVIVKLNQIYLKELEVQKQLNK